MIKYALITGGSRGIGRAICIELAKMEYSIIINYKSNQCAAEETKHIIINNGGRAELLQFDVANVSEVETALFGWGEEHKDGYIAILVNNAGVKHDKYLAIMQQQEWHHVISTNLDGFFYVTQRLLRPMMLNRYGRIINIASVSALKGIAGQSNYAASKAALIGATKSLAQEVATRNITVNVVAPGFIQTEMIESIDLDNIKKSIPMGRFGTPEEVANIVKFLASDHASYITGSVISVDGGL